MNARVVPAFFCLFLTASAEAAELSHYVPGVPNVRDFQLPKDAGFYLSSYNTYFQSGRLNDYNGREIPTPGADWYPDVDVYGMTIPFLAVWKDVFSTNFDYGFMISPSFGNSSLGASQSAESDRSELVTTQFGFGDLYVQPLWIGFSEFDPDDSTKSGRWAASLSWGFHAPTGKYDTDPVSPGSSIRFADPDNIGLGMWTNQFRGALQLSPWPQLGTAFMLAATYEVNSEKDDLRITPGDNLALNWGISQYFPKEPIKGWFFEAGPAGYQSWQVSDDGGPGARDTLRNQVHAAGFQLGITHADCLNVINFHYFNEYHTENRLQGHVIGLSITSHFGGPGKLASARLQGDDCACPWR